MCEPNHSIVQFPDHDDDGNPTSSIIDAIPATDSLWSKLKKKILGWFHFSYMGAGHSESLGRMSASARDRLPMDIKYEASWWNRGFHLDCGRRIETAFEAAKEYANRVSIGNLTTLRQFLEMSMRKSESPYFYIGQFPQMLVPKGRDLFAQKLARFGLKVPEFRMGNFREAIRNRLDLVIKVMLGFTRKRNLLVCEWADDTKLWGAT